jgi:hypothetical protein
MTLINAVDRVSGDFVEMPGLELTVAQAARLWNMDAGACGAAIESLVKSGFLRWTTKGTVVRTGLARPQMEGLGAPPGPPGPEATADS